MRMLELRASPIRVISLLALSISVQCCGSGSPVAPSATDSSSRLNPPAPFTGVVQGVVLHETVPCIIACGPPPHPNPPADATVTLITAAFEGVLTTTDDKGGYRLQVPAGAFRLRYSALGYQSAESAQRTISAGEEINMADVTLRTAPWAITGVVTDSRGVPVPGVKIAVNQGSFPFGGAPTVTSDASGRYRIESNLTHAKAVAMSIAGTGVVPDYKPNVLCCDPLNDTVYDFRVRHVLSVTMTGPSTLHVGETVDLPPAAVIYDDGPNIVYVFPASDSGSVSVGRGTRGYTIQGVSTGTATIAGDLFGLPLMFRVQVIP